MLSPNATKLVTLRREGADTVTVNVHAAVRCSVSVAVHVTAVAPTANSEPLAGAHAVVTGGEPAVVVADPYTTEIGLPSGDMMVTGDGHAICGGSGTGGLGCVGVPPQPPTSCAQAAPIRSC